MEIKNKLDKFNGNLVGVSTDMLHGWSFNNLKQELLLFDAVGLLGLDSAIEMYEEFPEHNHQYLKDIEFLLDKDVIFNAFPADFFPEFQEIVDINKLRIDSGLSDQFSNDFTI